jgi:hypothetical protein
VRLDVLDDVSLQLRASLRLDDGATGCHTIRFCGGMVEHTLTTELLPVQVFPPISVMMIVVMVIVIIIVVRRRSCCSCS